MLGLPAPAAATAAALDPQIQAVTEQARSAYLATQPFKRLNLAVWVQATPGGTWRGGEVDAAAQVYPASMVKLPFAIDSVMTCVERGAAPDCQRDDLVPMLVDSDNVATGRLVDGLTATRNLPEAASKQPEASIAAGAQAVALPTEPTEREAAYAQWLAARLHTEQRLQALGLRGGMRLFNKTYPTNSGEEPAGFEKRARAELGRNTMSAHDIAALMRALVDGDLDTRSGVPVLATLRPFLMRNRFSLQSALASGAPPGTQVVGKMGSAYDTLEEVAVLSWPSEPQKPRVLIAAFSDGLDQNTPEPFDGWRLAGLTTELLTRLNLMSPPQWQGPSIRRGTVVQWRYTTPSISTSTSTSTSTGTGTGSSTGTASTATVHKLEVQYRIPSGATGLRRVQLRCAPGCSTGSIHWTWPAALVVVRPLLLGELVVPVGATVEVEAELESATAAPGEVLWIGQ